MSQWFWRRKCLHIFNIILHFRYNLPLEKGLALHLNKFECPLTKDALCQILLKLDKGFWRRRFLNIFNIILHFRYYLPLEKGVAFHLNKLELTLLKGALCQVWLKLAKWFLRIRFLNIFNIILLFSLLSPLGKGRGPSFEKT